MTHHARQKAASPAHCFARGLALARRGDDAAAAEALAAAVRAEPGHVAALAALAKVLDRLGHADAAAATGAAALRLRPGHAEALAGFCAALVRLAGAGVPIAPYLAALPDRAPLLVQAGVALGQAGLLEPALAAFDLAAARHPAHPPALVNRGCALFKLGRFADACEVLRAALALAPGDAVARFGLANALLAQGAWAEGWPLYEARWELPGAAPRRVAAPRWRGEPLDGWRILVQAEQGFGDTLHFARFLPLVAARSGAVVLEVPAPLRRLAARFPGVAEVVPHSAVPPPCDVHAPLLSLPGLLGGTPDPVAPPYVTAAPELVARWAARLPGDGRPRVGLVWAGGPPRDNGASQQPDTARSMRFEQAAPLLAVPGVRWVSLQKGARAAGLFDPMGEVADFADTAAIVAALDLVISVDTSVAHLAGAMGRPVWLMCRWDPCWRWPRQGSTTPWYPAMRIFRQPRPGDWSSVVAEVAAALSQRWMPMATTPSAAPSADTAGQPPCSQATLAPPEPAAPPRNSAVT
jgi:tetratricopeptide (TPR) repeat protein